MLFRSLAFATVKVKTSDYERNEELIKSLKEDIKELHIYGQPELKKITLSKERAGCGFVLEYDRIAFGFLRAWFTQVEARSLEECVDAVVHEIESRTASFIKKELEEIKPVINRHKVKIEFQKGKIFPVVKVWQFTVITVIEENDFTFFFFVAGDDDPIDEASTIKEVEAWLINHVPSKKILAEEQVEYVKEYFPNLPPAEDDEPNKK